MQTKLNNKKVAILVANGFEESEFTKPFEALKKAEALVHVISLKAGKVKGWNNQEWGREITVDRTINEAKAADYDALVLPGGVMNPDQLRMNKEAVDFVDSFVTGKKPIAAICHGPWPLIETGKIKGRTLTSYPSIKTDLINAGANWVDQEVVVDGRLVTSRKPDDLPAFCKKMIEEISKSAHI